MTKPSDELLTEQQGNVLVVTLNRPAARNALSPGLISGIGRAALDADADPAIRAIVLTGAGDRAFCSGMDLRAFSSGDRGGGDEAGMAGFHRLINGQLAVPVIGAANGFALGGGLELLLGAEIIVASDQATFGFPEVKRGLFPAGGGTAVGTRIPLAVAMELILTGDRIDARRAYEIGLVNAVVAPDKVLDTALEFAGRVAANAPLALAACKELARLAVTDAARAAERELELRTSVFGSADAKEGATAFVEKREPVWQGR